MTVANRIRLIVTSKTVWGVVLSTGAWLLSQPKITVAEIIQAIGMILSAAGVRDAIARAMEAK